MRKPLPWFEIILGIVFLSGCIYAALSDAYNLPNRWFIRDDAYYYFKVAQNIGEGHGSTFDGIHLTNGYHPLWLLVCIPIFALARFDLILPLRVLALVTGGLQLTAAILLYHLVKSAISRATGMLVASYWAFNTYVLLFLYKTGVESVVALSLIVLLLYLVFRLDKAARGRDLKTSEIAVLGAVATVVMFSRLDLVFFVLIVGLWIVFRGSPMRYFMPLDALAIALATVVAFLGRLGFEAYYGVANSALFLLGAGILIQIPVLFLLGLYQPPATWKLLPMLGRLLLSTFLGGAVVSALLLGGSSLGLFPTFSRAILLLYAALGFGLLLIIRIAAYLFRLKAVPAPVAKPLDELKARWKCWLAGGASYYGIVGAALGAYMLWNRLAFGTSTPVSGQVKHWWGTFTHSIYGTSPASWLTFFAVNPFSEFNAWAPPTTTLSDWSNVLLYKQGTGFGGPAWQNSFLLMLGIAFIAACAVLLIKKQESVRAVVRAGMIPLFVGSWFQILAYTMTGYASPKEWYWLTEPILMLLAAAALLHLMELILGKWVVIRVLVWAFVAFYGIEIALGYWRDAYALNPYGQTPPGTPYTDVIPFLEKSTVKGAVIGMTGGGNIGYLMPSRTVVNMDGLINSEAYFLALQSGSGADFLYDTGTRYVFANPSLLDFNPYHGQFAGRLRLLVNWGGKDLLRLLPKAAP